MWRTGGGCVIGCSKHALGWILNLVDCGIELPWGISCLDIYGGEGETIGMTFFYGSMVL
jgi:hypothetical protein